MIASPRERTPGAGGLAPAFAAARTRLGLIALLFVLAAVGWLWTADEMQGMDDGPWTELGTFAWFAGVWVVMMAAMMFPSLAPTVALYSRMTKVALRFHRSFSRRLPRCVDERRSACLRGCERWRTHLRRSARVGSRRSLGCRRDAVVAAVYELTPLKDICLGKCRSPLGFLLGAWRSGRTGASSRWDEAPRRQGGAAGHLATHGPLNRPFRDDERRLFAALSQHLVRAVVALQRRLYHMAIANESALTSLEGLRQGFLLVDAAAARPLYANRVARRLLDASDGLQLEAGALFRLRCRRRPCIARSHWVMQRRYYHGFRWRILHPGVRPGGCRSVFWLRPSDG